MRFFSKAKKKDGWLTIAFLGDGICVGSVRRVRDAKVAIDVAAFYPAETSSHSPEILEKLNRELRGGSYRCATLLADGEYQLLSVDAPNVPREELKTAVRWRLKDMLDFHVDDATIDVLDIPGDQNGGNQRGNAMFAVAARNSLLEARQQLFTEAKMHLRVIDIPEMAQRNISALLEPEGRGLALLSFNHAGGMLTVTFKGELYLSRRIDVTLGQLLEPDTDRQQVCFDKIALELQRSLDHFDRQFHFISVSKLLLAPTGAPGMHEYLASNLYMPVEAMELGDVFDLSNMPELQDMEQQPRYFLTLGAALRDEEVRS
ncbi:agglutinin biogenesis protein MshI [Oxalobacteraceae bacterium]|nr:agglutinin biogenesis protein MshI [Oxalobacteraceae bacterium]